MIAKGLDFDNVTLVIVINADSSLFVPDYRSSEKTFQLLTQVAGRAGRKELEGEIIIQTFNPDHYAIYMAKKHDYLSFYNREILIRKKLYYPPFCFIVAVRILSKDYDKGIKAINNINSYLRSNLDSKYIILGPSVSFKVNNTYRFQCIIKYKEKEELMKVLEYINEHYKAKNIKLEIDFNPNRL
jgi:primosomal protein N' (replication factor Y)